MAESTEQDGTGPSHRGVEIGVAVATTVFALVVIAGSMRAGIDWAFDGPKAGFFPFYVGLIILGASLFNLGQLVLAGRSARQFAQWAELRQVVAVVIPTAIYVALIPHVGIYVSSAALIAIFMAWIGRYGWHKVLPTAILIPIITFITFERWFLVPLPKGPIEAWLGY